MTFDDRVRALAYLGFTPRQTRFLTLVALHSGFCVRRQFAAFAGVEYGKNVRAFLDQLVSRGLARRLQFDVNRGHVYHLSAGEVYRAIGQDDNRNRRATSAALIARKLMLLDFVLAQPADEWVATEADKVALFRDRYDMALAHLPRQMPASSATGRVRPAQYSSTSSRSSSPPVTADGPLHVPRDRRQYSTLHAVPDGLPRPLHAAASMGDRARVPGAPRQSRRAPRAVPRLPRGRVAAPTGGGESRAALGISRRVLPWNATTSPRCQRHFWPASTPPASALRASPSTGCTPRGRSRGRTAWVARMHQADHRRSLRHAAGP